MEAETETIDPAMLCTTCKKREVAQPDDDWCEHCAAGMQRFQDLMDAPPDPVDEQLKALRLDRFSWSGDGTLVEAARPLLQALATIDGPFQGGATIARLASITRGTFLLDDEPDTADGFERLLVARIERAMSKLVRAGFAYSTGVDEDKTWAPTSVGWAILDADFG